MVARVSGNHDLCNELVSECYHGLVQSTGMGGNGRRFLAQYRPPPSIRRSRRARVLRILAMPARSWALGMGGEQC